ncbi:MAG: sortase [Alphaproteobacteria bacterium]|nr:sortase [Alphaproteobacteria bacterium]
MAPLSPPFRPTPGGPGVSVISARRDTHFRGLDQLAPAAVIGLQTADGRKRRYRVSGSRILETPELSPPTASGANGLALVTCWPLDGGVPGRPERFVLFADEIPAPVAAGARPQPEGTR